MIREPGAFISPEEEALLGAYEHRRLAGEPVSRILGRREFWGLDFAVTPSGARSRAPTAKRWSLAALDLLARGRSAPHSRSRHRLGLPAAGASCRTVGRAGRRRRYFRTAALDVARANAGCARPRGAAGFVGRLGSVGSCRRRLRPRRFQSALYRQRRDRGARCRRARPRSASRARWRRRRSRCLPGAGARLAAGSRAARACGGQELGFGQADAVAALFGAAGLCVVHVVSDLGGVPRALVAGLEPQNRREG